MPRGYRYVIAAAFGWLSLTAASPSKQQSPTADKASAPDQIREASQAIVSAIRDTDKPAEHDRGCAKGSDKRESDLCAQWKAADAAADAATYSFWTLIGTAIGTGLLVWTLAQTRSTSRRELRAYVSLRSGGLVVQKSDTRGTMISFEVTSHNGGTTPAYDCVHLATLAITTKQQAAIDLKEVKPIEDEAYSGGVVIHSGDDFTSEMPTRILVSPDLIEAIKDGKVSLYMFGVSSYIDTFGVRRRTDFCQYIDGDRFSDALDKGEASPGEPIVTKWSIAPFHNKAT